MMTEQDFCRWATEWVLTPWKNHCGVPEWELFAGLACKDLTKLGYMELEDGYYFAKENEDGE